MPAVGCFDASAFQRLVEGQFAVHELEQFASHLERCNRCAGLVQNLPEAKLVALVGSVKRLPAHGEEASRLLTLIQRMLNLRGNVETLDQLAFASESGGAAPASVSAAATPAAPPPAAPPSFIGRYRIVRELGRGGMGTVYQAEDMELRRLVALKVPHFSGSAEHQKLMRQRFLREARAAAAVEHPYVCKIHDVGEQDGTPFVVMAFVEGPSLAGRMANLRRVNDRAAVALILRIAEALLAVHAKGIIHRDLKPANILLPKDTMPILTDFGLAHVHAESAHLTGEGALLGTPAYMAPEQAVVELGPVTTRTDLYSLAVVLFQLLSGRLPVEGDTMQILAHHVARKPAPPPLQFRPDLDPVLDGIIRKAMAVRPEDRHRDVNEFSQALKDWGRRAAARPGGAADTAPARSGSAADTMTPLAAVQPPTLAQPAALPIAEILTGPQPMVLPVAQVSAAAAPQPLPVMSEPRRWAWWHLAAAVLLLASGVAVGIIILRGNNIGPDGGPMANGDDKKSKEQPKPGQAAEIIDENFKDTLNKGVVLPDGWSSDTNAFAVRADKNRRPSLQVIEKGTASHLVTVRHRSLNSNFTIEGDFVLVNSWEGLTVQLESSKSGSRLSVAMSSSNGKVAVAIADKARNGKITVAIADKARNASGTKIGEITHFRLIRKGKALQVFIDPGQDAVAIAPLPQIEEYDTLRIGLNAGGFARLYSLKVGPLPQ